MEKSASKLAFLFPGQGSQHVEMGAYLYENHPPSRQLFKQADEILDLPLTEFILKGPEDKLKETEITQPAILTVSVATGNYLLESGLKPSYTAGHSLGEYSALVLAGSMDFSDAVRVVRLRGRFMQEAVPAGVGTMAAVLGLQDEVVDGLCARVAKEGPIVEPAGYNCPGQVVVAGEVAGVERVVALAKEQGAKARMLNVSAPFHCSMLRPAADALANELKSVTFRTPETPYFSNVDAKMVTNHAEIAEKLIEQVCRPVRWSQTLMNMFIAGTGRFIESGPGRVLVGHLKKVERRKDARAAVFAITDKETDMKTAIDSFAE